MKKEKVLYSPKWQYILLIAAGLLAFIVSMIESILPEENFYTSCNLSIFNVLICYGVISVFFFKKMGRDFFAINRKGVLNAIVMALCVVFICYFFQNAVFNLLYVTSGYIPEKYKILVENIMYEKNNHSVIERIVLIFSFGIITPFFEELFFRFVMLENFEKTSITLRFIMVNLCFVLIHDDIELMIFVTPLSIICSFLMHCKRRFLYPFIVHCIVNIVGIIEIPLDELAFSPRYAIQYGEKATAITNIFFNLVVVAFFVTVLYTIIRGQKKKDNMNKEILVNSIDNLFYFFSVGIYFLLQYFAG